MKKILFLVLMILCSIITQAQLVNVETEYNDIGDCIFTAQNNSKVPLFLYVNFADIQNATFDEPLPYVKCVQSGFNSLFMLMHLAGVDGFPTFDYDIKVFYSDPFPKINLDYPYLIPFKEGSSVNVFDVKDIVGFNREDRIDSWTATGFVASDKDVYACRNGIVVDIATLSNSDRVEPKYTGWKNSITVLQPDGTLLCYKNVENCQNLHLGQKVFAGQKIGKMPQGTNKLIVVVYYESINSNYLSFIIPQFVTAEDKVDILNSSTTYTVIHPGKVRGKEMTKKEKKKYL
jgi:hypothetical protein